ncbi:uncharacterized protein LOC127626277 isoform X2 [Xyrauchen texanus]|nr:uncharacterized protein LOC127626277 isoform X2 [Xyrauchen texanus]XP_051957915.1 uncharacterized protein LOC127626277 isoform X2 [Xyrauchen texanus]
MLVLEAVPPLDIRQVLSAVSSGREIINNLQDTGVINRKQRITLTQILVSFLIERFGQRPSTSIKQALALSLVQTFPALNDNSDSGYDIWYTKARKLIKDGGVIHYPATGFLEERLRNVRKRSNRGSTQQMPEASQSRRAYIPESTVPEERAFQQKEWLKHNSEPFTQVQSYMKDTVLSRANWIRGNSSKDILEILTEYPHLTSPGMILQDFLVLHGEAAPKLFETWLPEYAEKVLYLAKQENKLPSVTVEDMTLDAKGELALTLLPTMVPQAVYRVGKKSIRHSTEESRTAFIHQMPVGTNMVEYLQQSQPFPSVLALGDPQQCASQAFVILAGQALPQSTLLGAVDVCFKAFYVLDINYPKQCAPAWEFLQQVVYQIEGSESKPVKFLKTSLLNCRTV